MTKLGPVEYAIFEFPGTKIGPVVLPALRNLVKSNTIRIIDLIVVQKDADGTIRSAELGELPPDQSSIFEGLNAEVLDLFNAEDIEIAAQDMPPNSTAAMIVWENVWAAGFTQAVSEAGGRVAANERIPAQIIQDALDASVAV